jgi:UDP-glucose 4-epimerase
MTSSTPISADARKALILKVLVTGGSGFIGSHVVDVLLARGHEVVNFDRVQSPHHDLGAVPTAIGDATDTKALVAAMKGCEAVVHLAAMADVNDVQKDPEGAERANARATLAVLEAARRAGVKRVVYGSTIWVYSDCPETAVDEDTRFVMPGHLYTATKLAGELYCRSYAELYGVDYTILRFGIPYGPRARDATVLAAFVNKALAGEPMTVAGSGSQGRRFVYVEDLADGVERALAPDAANRVYNLAGSETTTILEIAETVRGLVGDAEIVHTEARAGDFGGKEVSSARALAELDWEPKTPFCEGARRYVEWRRDRDTAPVGRLAALRARVPVARRGKPAFRLRPVVSSVLVTAGFFWSFASDDGLSLIAKAIPSTKPVTAVDTASPQVGLIVDSPASIAPDVARELEQQGASASIALSGHPSKGTVDAVRASGSDAVPRLRPGGPLRWIGTRSQIHSAAKDLGLKGHIYYAVPGSGFTLAQDLLGHTAGATPVSGGVKVAQYGHLGKNLERGDLIEVSLGGDAGWRPWIGSLVRQVRAHGYTAVSAATLLRSGPADR